MEKELSAIPVIDKDHAKRLRNFQKRRLRYLPADKFAATYSVDAQGVMHRKGPQGSLRRARKDARKLRTSHPGKLITDGGIRPSSWGNEVER